jgi:hypothetical protein
MKFADLLIIRDSGDLKLAMDALATYWNSLSPLERPKGDVCQMVSDVLSYRRRLDDLPKEYVSTLWAGVDYLLKRLNGVKAKDLVADSKVVRNPEALTVGDYWVLDGEFHRCDASHEKFIVDNQPLFIDKLGLDAWQLMRARHSSMDGIIRLALMSGAALASIGKRDGVKYAKYQCCAVSIPELKRMATKMAIKTSIFRAYDPSKPYTGPSCGIMFVVKH